MDPLGDEPWIFPKRRLEDFFFRPMNNLTYISIYSYVSHNGKVKAVLVGHMHHYSRMRVKDPRSPEANDTGEYPDQEGGVYQIDCGDSGNGARSTVVNIEIMGKDVFFRVVDAVDFLGGEFSLIDEWKIRSAQ